MPLKRKLRRFQRAAVAGTLLGAIAFGSYFYMRIDWLDREARREALLETELGARRMADKLQHLLERAEHDLGRIRQRVENVLAPGLNDLNAGFNGPAGRSEMPLAFVTDAEGRVLETAELDTAAQGQVVPEALKKIIQTHSASVGKGLRVSEPLRWPGLEDPMLVFSVRYDVDGQFAGVIGLGIEARALIALLTQGEASGVGSTLSRFDGVYLLRDGSVAARGLRISLEDLDRRMVDARRTLTPIVSPIDGSRRFASAERIEAFGVRVAYSLPEARVMAPVWQSRQRLIGWSLLLILLSSGAGVLLWRLGERMIHTGENALRLGSTLGHVTNHLDEPALLLRTVHDRMGHVVNFMAVDCNAALAAMGRWGRAGVFGKLVNELIEHFPYVAIIPECLHALESGRSRGVPVRNVFAGSDREVWHEYQVIPLSRSDGLFLLVLVDITAEFHAGNLVEAGVQARYMTHDGEAQRVSPERRHRIELALERARQRQRRHGGERADSGRSTHTESRLPVSPTVSAVADDPPQIPRKRRRPLGV